MISFILSRPLPGNTCFALALMLLSPTCTADVVLDMPEASLELRQNVEAHLSLMSEHCDAPAWRVKRRFRYVDKEAQPALRALGYYGAKVDKTLSETDTCWLATITIDAGTPVRVETMTLTLEGDAASDPAFAALQDNLPLKTGDILHHGHYEAIQTELRNLALERGYFEAELTQHELIVNPDTYSAQILLTFNSGPRYRFGDLHFSPQPLDEQFVRKLAGLPSATVYEARQLTRMDRNLSDAGYYQSVEINAPRETRSDQTVPISVTLTPKPRHAWRSGIGFATDTGPRLSTAYEDRYINPRGHSFNSELRLAPVESGLTGSYRIPGADPHKSAYLLSAGILREDTDTSLSDSLQLSVRHTETLHYWQQVRSLQFLDERSEIGGVVTEASLLMPGMSWSHSEADNLLRTNRGYRLSLDLKAAHESLLSTASFAQLRAYAKGIKRVSDQIRLSARAELGTTLGGHFIDLPASLRFFAGGDNSVRGYSYKSLGPTDSSGHVVGGRHLLTTSIEYEQRLFHENWWGALFTDAGNAFDSSHFNAKRSYGAGLRWYSPVGRVRLDIAFPEDTTEDSWRLHLGFGADL